MNADRSKSAEMERLRKRAEAALLKLPHAVRDMAQESTDELGHELRTYQIELELQNEELRRTQHELVESRDKYSDLYDFAPIGYFTLDRQGLIVEANLTGAELLQVERRYLVGRSFSRFVAPDSQDAFFQHRRQVLEAGISHACELCLKLSDDTLLEVQSKSSLITYADDTCQMRMALMDISERKVADRQREDLITMLQSKNTELDQFAHTASHDLKNPLITIKGYAEILADDLTHGRTESAAEALSCIQRAAGKMDQLLTELLDLSQVGRVNSKSDPVSLEELAHEVVEQRRSQVDARGIEVDILPGLPTVCGNRIRLLQALQNLIDNAVKYIGDQPHPRIVIGASNRQSQTVCFVRDNGLGIESHHLTRIFDLFYQLDPRIEGSGVGLAIVARIIGAHGGRIWVESQGPGHGSTFYFTLPGSFADAIPYHR